MLRSVVCVARWVSVLVVVAVVLAGSAEARKSIPIPCLDKTAVKVLDFPNEPAVAAVFRRTAFAPRLNLAYRFSNCFWGEWGVASADLSWFQSVPDWQMKQVLAASGLRELPQEPHYLTHLLASWRLWLWIVIFGYIAYRNGLRVPWPSAMSAKPGKSVAYTGPDYWSPEAIAARHRELASYAVQPGSASGPPPSPVLVTTVPVAPHSVTGAPTSLPEPVPLEHVQQKCAAVLRKNMLKNKKLDPVRDSKIDEQGLAPMVVSSPILPGRTARVLGPARPALAPAEPLAQTAAPSRPAPTSNLAAASVSPRPPRTFGRRPAA